MNMTTALIAVVTTPDTMLMRSWLENNFLIIEFLLFNVLQKNTEGTEVYILCTFGTKFYSTTIAVLLGSPSPALLMAIMRYSSFRSFPWSCSTSVASRITWVATSSQSRAARSLFRLRPRRLRGIRAKTCSYFLKCPGI